ncbi:MAG: hypothetical protein P4L57_02560 [Rhizomicrobium sp.]|nr:hypothetical protein [Rhizomicrobium sp.]
MKTRITILAALSMTIAVAAPAQAGCDKFEHASATILSLDSSGKDFAASLRASLIFGLDKRGVMAHALSAQQPPCSHGSFIANNGSYGLFGEDSKGPARWAISAATPDAVIVLAAMPLPETAPALQQQYKDNPGIPVMANTRAMMFALAISTSDAYRIYRYYDDIPSDAVMKLDMCKAVTGQLAVLAIYDADKRTVQLPDKKE